MCLIARGNTQLVTPFFSLLRLFVHLEVFMLWCMKVSLPRSVWFFANTFAY